MLGFVEVQCKVRRGKSERASLGLLTCVHVCQVILSCLGKAADVLMCSSHFKRFFNLGCCFELLFRPTTT